MGSLLAHYSLWTRPFFRRSSSPTLSPRPRTSTPRRFAVPLLCLLVVLLYEVRVRYLQSSLTEALANKHVIHITREPPAIDPLDNGRPSLRALRRSYERKRRKEEFNKRLNATELGGPSTFVLPQDKVELVQTLLAGTGGEISPGILNWTMVDDQDFTAEIGMYWPEWWTSADSTPSMWDYRPGEKEQRRLLFLTDYTDYLERMNSHTYEIVDAALRIPYLSVDVWGPGWAGYDRNLSISTNVRRRQCRLEQLERWHEEAQERRAVQALLMPANASAEESDNSTGAAEDLVTRDDEPPSWLDQADCGCAANSFHVVWTISDIFKQSDPHVDVLDCGSLLVQQIGDCHNLNCFNEWYPQANNITLSKYAFELMEVFDHETVKARYPEWEMGMFGHSPDTGNEWDFFPIPFTQKPHKVTIFGFQGSFYPIRTTVSFSIDYDPVPWIRKHPHPGYNVAIQPQATQLPLETYSKGHEYYTGQEEIRRDFARGMREAQICLFDASLERKMIRKFAQALLSGCVIAADLPTEHERALSNFVIPLSPDMDMPQIEQVLKGYLDQPERLEQMALEGFIYARQYLTTTRKVDDVMRMSDEYRSGVRGYDFSFGFSSKCRKYWSDDDSYRPPWC